MDDQQRPVILIVHGAWHQPRHYRDLINDFRAKGYTVAAPPLASSGEDDSIATKTYHDDVKRVHDSLCVYLEQGRTIVGIGHSYGSVVLGVAILGHTVAERESKGLKGGFISAAFIAGVPAFEKGISLFDAGGRQWRNGWFHSVTDTCLPVEDKEMGKKAFYSGLDQATQDWAIDGICNQSHAPMMVPLVSTPADHSIPKLYIVCTQDNLLPKDFQGMIAEKWGARTMEVDCGHSPFLSDVLRKQIVEEILAQLS